MVVIFESILRLVLVHVFMYALVKLYLLTHLQTKCRYLDTVNIYTCTCKSFASLITYMYVLNIILDNTFNHRKYSDSLL